MNNSSYLLYISRHRSDIDRVYQIAKNYDNRNDSQRQADDSSFQASKILSIEIDNKSQHSVLSLYNTIPKDVTVRSTRRLLSSLFQRPALYMVSIEPENRPKINALEYDNAITDRFGHSGIIKILFSDTDY